MIIAALALRAANAIGRATAELAALGVFVGMIGVWAAYFAGA